eukprot:scaffold1736_cov143-Isochrysis_galbana.AAC.1
MSHSFCPRLASARTHCEQPNAHLVARAKALKVQPSLEVILREDPSDKLVMGTPKSVDVEQHHARVANPHAVAQLEDASVSLGAHSEVGGQRQPKVEHRHVPQEDDIHVGVQYVTVDEAERGQHRAGRGIEWRAARVVELGSPALLDFQQAIGPRRGVKDDPDAFRLQPVGEAVGGAGEDADWGERCPFEGREHSHTSRLVIRVARRRDSEDLRRARRVWKIGWEGGAGTNLARRRRKWRGAGEAPATMSAGGVGRLNSLFTVATHPLESSRRQSVVGNGLSRADLRPGSGVLCRSGVLIGCGGAGSAGAEARRRAGVGGTGGTGSGGGKCL